MVTLRQGLKRERVILVGGGIEKVEIEKVHEEDVLNGAPGLKSDSSNICYCQLENHISHLLLNCQWMETRMSQIHIPNISYFDKKYQKNKTSDVFRRSPCRPQQMGNT